MSETLVGTPRCGVPARVQRAESFLFVGDDVRSLHSLRVKLETPYVVTYDKTAARTAQRAVPTLRRCASLLTLALAFATAGSGCRRDMFQQPFSKPLEPSDFFQDNHMASRPLVLHTVARGHLDADTVLYTGKVGTNLVETFPFPITREILERGRERFDIYCAPCHGRTGDGNGMIVQRGFPPPPSYHIDRLRQAPVGHFFDVITHGYGIMYPYAERVEPYDRWAIAAYIRALQKSHEGTLAEVPPRQRATLEAEK